MSTTPENTETNDSADDVRRNPKLSITQKFILWLLSYNPFMLLFVFSILLLLITILVALFYNAVAMLMDCVFPTQSSTFIAESLKILGAAIFAGFVALLISNSWQQKSVGFEMLKELYSPEFYEVRRNLVTQMRISRISGIDIENMETWFPMRYFDPKEKFYYNQKEDFTRIHALTGMVYFVVRLSNYMKDGMLNITTSKNLFAPFFCHYQIVILGFANAMECYYNKTYKNLNHPLTTTEVKEEIWLTRINDIRNFFLFLDLDIELSIDEKYKYFPSLKPGATNDDKKRAKQIYAYEVDYEVYQDKGLQAAIDARDKKRKKTDGI